MNVNQKEVDRIKQLLSTSSDPLNLLQDLLKSRSKCSLHITSNHELHECSIIEKVCKSLNLSQSLETILCEMKASSANRQGNPPSTQQHQPTSYQQSNQSTLHADRVAHMFESLNKRLETLEDNMLCGENNEEVDHNHSNDQGQSYLSHLLSCTSSISHPNSHILDRVYYTPTQSVFQSKLEKAVPSVI